MDYHPSRLPVIANDNRMFGARGRESCAIQAAILTTHALCGGGGWLVEAVAPRAPVLNMALAAAGARLAATFR